MAFKIYRGRIALERGRKINAGSSDIIPRSVDVVLNRCAPWKRVFSLPSSLRPARPRINRKIAPSYLSGIFRLLLT